MSILKILSRTLRLLTRGAGGKMVHGQDEAEMSNTKESVGNDSNLRAYTKESNMKVIETIQKIPRILR